MAETNGLVGGITGRVGNVIGYFRRGKFLLRAYNPHTTNPQTMLQRLQRRRMSMTMKLLKEATSILKIGFYYAKPGYELVNAVKKSLPGVMGETPEAVTIDFSKIVLSQNQFSAMPVMAAPTFATAAQIALTNELPSDAFIEELPSEYQNVDGAKLVVAVYNATKKVWDKLETPYDEAASVTMTTPTDWTGDTVHVYGFIAVEPDRILGEGGRPCMVGPTVYAGTGVIS